MKRLTITLLLLCGMAVAQGVRFGDGQPVWTPVTIPGVSGTLLKIVASPQINFCGAPNVGVPCTNLVTTYTDSSLTTACPLTAQIVLAGSSSCSGTGDSFGNWGIWAPPGQYTYTITSGGNNYGPFYASLSPVVGGFVAVDTNGNATIPGTMTIGSLQVSGPIYITSACASGTIAIPPAGVFAMGTESDCYLHFIPGAGVGLGQDFRFTGTNSSILPADGGAVVGNSSGNVKGVSNCTSATSPAVCADARVGAVVIAASATSVVVNTTPVTANSAIEVKFDESLGSRFSPPVTCNTASGSENATYIISAKTVATSFTIKTNTAPNTNPACLTYSIIN